MKQDPLHVNLSALNVIALVSHNPATIAHAKRVAAAYRAVIERKEKK